MSSYISFIIFTLLLGLSIIVPLLLTIAFYTIGERKAMGSIQRRKGPNVVGFWGLLQPIADGLKLIIKEILIPRKANVPIYLIAPLLTFGLSLMNWAVIPFSFGVVYADINMGVLYLLALSGLGVYGVILSGWASNSKYSLLGGLRAAAQMVSYEIVISLCIFPVIMITGTLNLTEIIFFQTTTIWNLIPLFPLSLMLFIAILAETNRAPFDLPEAEAEIVAGYNLEYSGILFAMFFLGEYGNMIIMSSMLVIFFLGGWSLFIIDKFLYWGVIFAIKTVFIAYLFVLVRALLPRYRFDQLMQLSWKTMLPMALGFFIFSSSILVGFDIMPTNSSLIYMDSTNIYRLHMLPNFVELVTIDHFENTWLDYTFDFSKAKREWLLRAYIEDWYQKEEDLRWAAHLEKIKIAAQEAIEAKKKILFKDLLTHQYFQDKCI